MEDKRYNQLLDDLRSFINARYDLLLLSLLEKMSRILGLIMLVLVVILLAFAAFAYGGLALAFVLSKWIPMWAACLIMGGVFLLLLVMAVIFRKQWFINPVIVAISGILFSSPENKQAAEEPSVSVPQETRKGDDHE